MRFVLFILAATIFTGSKQVAEAEPWLSNRYAQNCAACHAPGRLNLPPKERRCTLSCQGCHVNPNGGGTRNEYGIWLQQRWLRSFKSDKLHGNKNTPAPHYQQPYIAKSNKPKDTKSRARKPNQTRSRVAIMKETKKIEHDPRHYDKHTYIDWKVDAQSWPQFLARVPINDPWREQRRNMILASGDIRYFYGRLTGANISKDQEELNSLMAVDIGVRVKPIPQHLSFVVESRFGNDPRNSHLEQGFTSSAQVRSAYVLSDYLAWNSWGMAGLYRPHFGHYNPDHNTLASRLSGLNHQAVFKSIGVGTAPNVPFANVHYIQPIPTAGKNQEKGFNINVGGRFVTHSLSGKLSYWNTEDQANGAKKQMYSATAGGMYKDIILNYELLRIILDETNGASNAGNVNTFELKYRVWRENFLVLNYALSNVYPGTTINTSVVRPEKGNASEIMAGIKSFLFPGVEVEALYIQRQNSKKSTPEFTHNTNSIQLQAHLFF